MEDFVPWICFYIKSVSEVDGLQTVQWFILIDALLHQHSPYCPELTPSLLQHYFRHAGGAM